MAQTQSKTASELSRQALALAADAADGDRIEITSRGREHVTLMSTAEARRLDYATAALQGFLRLAARGAECWEYQERAEDLVHLIKSGALRLPADITEEAATRAAERERTAEDRANAKIDQWIELGLAGAQRAAGILGVYFDPEQHRGRDTEAREWFMIERPKVVREFIEQHRADLVAKLTSINAT